MSNSQFGAGSISVLNGLRGKQVLLEMMSGQTSPSPSPMAAYARARWDVTGELVQVYDDSILIKDSDGKKHLIFARAIRSVTEA